MAAMVTQGTSLCFTASLDGRLRVQRASRSRSAVSPLSYLVAWAVGRARRGRNWIRAAGKTPGIGNIRKTLLLSPNELGCADRDSALRPRRADGDLEAHPLARVQVVLSSADMRTAFDQNCAH